MNFYFDKRMLYTILIIMAAISLFTMGTNGILAILLTLPGVIIAITFHEYAHAWAADRLGDSTPRMQGRLNLNPLSHLDPIGIFMLVFVHIGWGKPVEINPNNFNHNMSIAKAESIVSAAGPIMNFILAIVFTIVICVIMKFAEYSFLASTAGTIIMTVIQYTVIVNIGLGVFNLIPLPPLDGSKIFMNMMPYNMRNWLLEHQSIFYIIFLALWITGLAGSVISPIIDLIYKGIFGGISAIFGLF